MQKEAQKLLLEKFACLFEKKEKSNKGNAKKHFFEGGHVRLFSNPKI